MTTASHPISRVIMPRKLAMKAARRVATLIADYFQDHYDAEYHLVKFGQEMYSITISAPDEETPFRKIHADILHTGYLSISIDTDICCSGRSQLLQTLESINDFNSQTEYKAVLMGDELVGMYDCDQAFHIEASDLDDLVNEFVEGHAWRALKESILNQTPYDYIDED